MKQLNVGEAHKKRLSLSRTTAVDSIQLRDVLSSLPTQFGCSTIQSVEVILTGMLRVLWRAGSPFKGPLCASHIGVYS